MRWGPPGPAVGPGRAEHAPEGTRSTRRAPERQGPSAYAASVPNGSFDVVLFDLGGVLIDVGGVEPMRALSGIASVDELWHRWLTCQWVQSFERGACPPEDFAAGVVADWGLALTPEAYLAAFRGWTGAPFPGAPELVAETRRAVPVGCLSNTNSLHWEDDFAHWPMLAGFDHRFLSFQIGLVKPDPQLFAHVIDALGLPPERVLFLDDNRLNVDAATAAGICARRAQGVVEARSRLVELGVLD